MTKETEFAEIKKYEEKLSKCVKCGFCTYWCPVYQEERVESAVARGKNMLVRSLLTGELKYTKEFVNRLNKCTLCMTCTANCPAKADIPSIIIAARADKVKSEGVAFPYNIIYRWLLPRRWLFGNTVRFASWFQGIFLPKTQGTVRHLSFFLSALGKGRRIPQIAPRFLRQMVPVVNKPSNGISARMTIGYFSGCMTEYVFPELGKKIINFLNNNGVEVTVPRKQGCCGAPVFLGAGDFETGRILADINVRAFRDLDKVVTNCATCASAMKSYLKFLANTPEREKDYFEFANKVMDITEFVVDILKLEATSFKAAPDIKGKKVTWHIPCHLSRYMGVLEQSKHMLKLIPDITYVEMPNADRCCGMAGTFSIYFYELSKKIADKKMESITATGADIVVTNCLGCEIQLIDTVIRHGKSVKVMHIMELIN